MRQYFDKADHIGDLEYSSVRSVLSDIFVSRFAWCFGEEEDDDSIKFFLSNSSDSPRAFILGFLFQLLTIDANYKSLVNEMATASGIEDVEQDSQNDTEKKSEASDAETVSDRHDEATMAMRIVSSSSAPFKISASAIASGQVGKNVSAAVLSANKDSCDLEPNVSDFLVLYDADDPDSFNSDIECFLGEVKSGRVDDNDHDNDHDHDCDHYHDQAENNDSILCVKRVPLGIVDTNTWHRQQSRSMPVVKTQTGVKNNCDKLNSNDENCNVNINENENRDDVRLPFQKLSQVNIQSLGVRSQIRELFSF
jgi:hypothetical protein